MGSPATVATGGRFVLYARRSHHPFPEVPAHSAEEGPARGLPLQATGRPRVGDHVVLYCLECIEFMLERLLSRRSVSYE